MEARMRLASCHQLPERSFHWKGRQLPVCARCTGVFAGQVLGLLTLLHPVPWWLSASLLLPLLVDWALQQWFSKPSTNIRRFVTGFLAGGGEVALLIAGVSAALRLLR